MIENIKKFKLLQDNEDSLVEGLGVTMLINLAHLVSVKPINVATQAGVVQAYWIRLSNGKKYKATEIPEELRELLKDDVMTFAQINGQDSESTADIH